MRICLAQLNPIVGDINGNCARILSTLREAKRDGADLVLFSELVLTGYPPEDLLLLPHFIKEVECMLEKIVESCHELIVVVGVPRLSEGKAEKHFYNSAAVIMDRQLLGFYDKCLLPTYDVFDERRYFEPGNQVRVWELKGKRVAITICEDIWQHSEGVGYTSYNRDPISDLKGQKVDFLLNLSASPYSLKKFENRLQVCISAAKTLSAPVFFCNQVGANDNLVFDGYSFCVNAKGELSKVTAGFREELLTIDTEALVLLPEFSRSSLYDLYRALVLGVRDYFSKCGCKTAVIGLSGGIDSAVAAKIVADALGKESVLGLLLPSRFSSESSVRDAELLAKNLGITHWELSIESPFQSYLDLLKPHFGERPFDVAEENIQARIRGMLLMAVANKFNRILINTSNKSELAMGYSTLYGDSCGGLGVLSDVTKRQIYALADLINREEEVIPQETINKPPSAELSPDQKDLDTLPPYEQIDCVLQGYVEEHKSPQKIAEEHNYPLAEVEHIIQKIHQSEYKRRQFCLGLRVSEKAFTFGRHFPVVQRFVT